MVIDRIPLDPAFLEYSQAEYKKRHLRNLIHQQIPLIPAMRSTAQPIHNTNHRRMERNGLVSLRRSAQNLLIAFPFCLPLFLCFPSLLRWILWNRCNHQQFAGHLAAGLSPTADRVRACWCVKIRVYVWVSTHGGACTQKVIWKYACVLHMCVRVCQKVCFG